MIKKSFKDRNSLVWLHINKVHGGWILHHMYTDETQGVALSSVFIPDPDHLNAIEDLVPKGYDDA